MSYVEEKEVCVEEDKGINQAKDRLGDNIEELEQAVFKKSHKGFMIISSMILITCVGVLGYFTTQGLLTSKSLHERYNINDHGVIQAIKSDFMQDIRVSSEHNGLTFTVDHIIVDEKRLMILYTIKSNRKKGYLNSVFYKIQDGEGNELPLGLEFPDIDMNFRENKTYRNHLNFVFSESEVPERIQLDLNLLTSEYSRSEAYEKNIDIHRNLDTYQWHLSIPIDHRPFQDKKIVYDLKKSFTIDDQKIYISGLTIYPTITIVDVCYDEHNTKKIFELVDFKIMDHNKAFDRGIGGLTTSRSGNNLSMYFESNYFQTDNKKLSLTGTGIRALDKNALEVIVDIDNKQVLQSPDNQIILDNISNDCLVFKHPLDGLVFDMGLIDGEGNEYSTNSQGFSSGVDGHSIFFNLPNKKLVSPLTLTISNYPTIIEHPFEIKILE